MPGPNKKLLRDPVYVPGLLMSTSPTKKRFKRIAKDAVETPPTPTKKVVPPVIEPIPTNQKVMIPAPPDEFPSWSKGNPYAIDGVKDWKEYLTNPSVIGAYWDEVRAQQQALSKKDAATWQKWVAKQRNYILDKK